MYSGVANWQLRGFGLNSCFLPLVRDLRYNIPEVSPMPTRAKRLEALYNCGLMVGQNPWYAFLFGYLVGQVDRVHFIRDTTDAEIAITIDLRKKRVWPSEPFKATVRGITMPNTFTLVRAMADTDAPICLSVDFEEAEDTPWYQEVTLPNFSYIKDASQAANEESEALWREMDHSLDVYRECRALLEEAGPERRRELSYYMKLAEEQMKKLSAQMDELNKHMKRISEQETQD